MDFKEAIKEARLSPKQAAEKLGVLRNTIYNYCRSGAPRYIMLALDQVTGKIQGWRGFQVKGDHIITPSGEKLHQTLLDAFEYWSYLQRLHGWEAKNRPTSPDQDNRVITFPRKAREVLTFARAIKHGGADTVLNCKL